MSRSSNLLAWDADGVVIDSRKVAWRTAEDIVGLFGSRPCITSPQDNNAVFGRAAQARLVGEDSAAALRTLHRLVMRARAGEADLFGDVLDVVAGLVAPPRLITAAYAEGVRRALGPRAALFASIVGRESGAKEGLIEANAADGLRWFVTDTVRDLRRCRACGVAVLAVTWGFDPAADLAKADPEILVHDVGQLAEALKGLSLLRPSFSPPNQGTTQ